MKKYHLHKTGKEPSSLKKVYSKQHFALMMRQEARVSRVPKPYFKTKLKFKILRPKNF